MKFLLDCIKGVFIGSGAILPGISSGVLCVIFGIYDKLVESVLGIFKDKKNFFYLLPIALGGFVGIFLFGNILKALLVNFPMQTQYAFIGLILGSTPLLIKKVNSQGSFKLHYLFYAVFAFAVGLLAVCLESYISSSSILTNFATNASLSNNGISLQAFLLLTIAGFFMSVGIVVPGVSSTVILMCFGVYETYIAAIASMNLSILIPIGLGVVTGSIIFLSVIRYLFKHYYMQTFYAIIGFSLGSIFVLYMPLSFDITGFISLVLFISFFYIAGKLENL